MSAEILKDALHSFKYPQNYQIKIKLKIKPTKQRQGIDGSIGEIGLPGAPGRGGLPGNPGAAGEPGTGGEPGLPGTDGFNGMGGQKGTSGTFNVRSFQLCLNYFNY